MSEKDIYNNLKSNIGLEKFKIKEKKSSKLENFKMGITGLICALSATTMVFAQNISTKIYDNYFGTGNGVGVAIENGYIEQAKTEGTESQGSIENEVTGKKVDGVDTKIKVDEFVMDDFNLSITFDVTLSDKIEDVLPIEKAVDMNFPDMIIYDEENTVLYHLMAPSIEQFCKEKNLNYAQYNLGSDKVVNCGVNSYVKEKKANHVKVLYNIYTGEETFPKSKKLNIFMKQIRIADNVETRWGEEEILLQGNWDFSVDVPEKMYNRQNVIYKQINTTNKDFKVTQAVLYDTGMNIKLEFPVEKVEYDAWNTPELQFFKSLPEDDELKTTEILNYISNKQYNTDEYIKSSEKMRNAYLFEKYITNEDGEKFGVTVGPRENGGASINDNSIMQFEGMFDITKYNASDELILHVDYHGNKEDITLKKVVE